MTDFAALVRSMTAAGATPEAIALAIEAIQEASDGLQQRRAADRERKQRQRDKSRDSHVTVTGQSADTPPSLAPSPQTPYPHTLTPVSVTTPATALAKPNGFARFWEAYPNKVGKRDAEGAYLRALKRIDGPDPPGLILAAVDRAKTGDRWRDGYIPNPSTWLNQDRWEDEPAPRPSTPDVRRAPSQPPGPSAKLLAREANYARAFAAPSRVAER